LFCQAYIYLDYLLIRLEQYQVSIVRAFICGMSIKLIERELFSVPVTELEIGDVIINVGKVWSLSDFEGFKQIGSIINGEHRFTEYFSWVEMTATVIIEKRLNSDLPLL